MTSLPSGSSLKNGEYTILSYIGQGGFGTTYKATRNLLNGQKKNVAIKIGRDALTDDERNKREEDFEDEAKRLKRFDHEHIVRFIEYFYDTKEQRPCLVMEYIEGNTLQELLKKGSRVTEEKAIKDTKDEGKLKEVLNLFEKYKHKYEGQSDFEELFSELTRRYAQDVLARSGEPGVRKGIEVLEEIKKRLEKNFDIEALPRDDFIAEEYEDVIELLNRMKKKDNDEEDS
ncbi:MAG: protein kinase [Symploca sp. SIO2E9]|nr:protein kinase [Symploca sp. SIO2E9]